MQLGFEPFLAIFDAFGSPRGTIQKAAEVLKQCSGAEGVSILVYSPERGGLVFELVCGGAESLVGTCITDGQGVAWWAFKNGFVVSERVATDQRFLHSVDKKTGFVTRNIVAFPFAYHQRPLGVIELVNVPGEVRDLNVCKAEMQVVGRLVGTAYVMTRMQERLAEQRRKLEVINTELEQRVRERTESLEKKNNELQQVQAQLIQREKMAGLGQLAAGVAHEINNPIGFIASNLNTARDYWKSLTTYIRKIEEANPVSAGVYRKQYDVEWIMGDLERLFDECLEGTARVTNIVKSLKEFAHQPPAERRLIDPHTIIERTLTIALSPYKHCVTVEKNYTAQGEICCDAQALGQVILNLVVNAAQAVGEQGIIRISTQATGERYVVSVADNGCGISPENLSRIFEPFFTTKEVGVGTGLGLSMCFHLVKQNGGDIRVESEVGHGTTFYVEFPLGQRIPQSEATGSHQPQAA